MHRVAQRFAERTPQALEEYIDLGRVGAEIQLQLDQLSGGLRKLCVDPDDAMLVDDLDPQGVNFSHGSASRLGTSVQ